MFSPPFPQKSHTHTHTRHHSFISFILTEKSSIKTHHCHFLFTKEIHFFFFVRYGMLHTHHHNMLLSNLIDNKFFCIFFFRSFHSIWRAFTNIVVVVSVPQYYFLRKMLYNSLKQKCHIVCYINVYVEWVICNSVCSSLFLSLFLFALSECLSFNQKKKKNYYTYKHTHLHRDIIGTLYWLYGVLNLINVYTCVCVCGFSCVNRV